MTASLACALAASYLLGARLAAPAGCVELRRLPTPGETSMGTLTSGRDADLVAPAAQRTEQPTLMRFVKCMKHKLALRARA